MSREHDQLADRAEAMIMAAIAIERRAFRQQLAKLEPLEAISLLGFLVADTLARFPADQRPDILAAFLAMMQDAAAP